MNERGMRDALMSGLRRITPEAVPAMVDCVMASTAVSPSSLFSSLLHAFPQENEKFVTEEKNFIMSSVSAFCHLLKKSGANVSAMESFIWKILIPILKSVHGHDCTVFSETADSFLNVVIETNTWVVVQESILPFCLRSLGLSMGMLQSDECAIYVWNTASVLDSNGQLINSKNNEDCTISEQENFPPHVSSCVLASILDYAIQSQYVVVSTLPTLAGESSAEIFVKYLLWDLCIMVPRMVLQSTELRSCAVKNLLPNIFQAFVPLRAFEISVRRQTHILSRSCLFRKFWMCCKTLFSMGTLERRDSYRLLSLCLSFVSCTGKNDDGYVFDGEEGFDIRTEKEFWDEMKKGLVDKEGIVRKQSLHILKMVFLESDGSNCYSDVSATKLNKEAATPNGITKKGRWAKKEAESLGIGKICNSLDSSLNSQQKWGAFFLLYEMLEEFGTHLVEAAWNHQITMLMHTSLLCDDLLNSVNEGQNQNEMEASKDIFKWLVVLWERGFMHDNPLVRCLIMESFLGIDWKSYKHCDKLVPELFVLGPFIEELNDPMHHKNFGIKGSYSSTTIEGAAIFIGQYASNLNVRKCIAFLINLVSAIKKQSFCRAGLMALTECITSAACGVKLHFNNEGYSLLTVQDQVAREKSVHNEKAEFLDGLRIIIESSKQHFNPKYRFRVCKNVLAAAVSVMEAVDVPIETLLLFISTVPREFTDKGSLRVEVQRWLSACDEQNSNFDSFGIVEPLLKRLCEFPSSFVGLHVPVKDFINYDDEDLDAWESKAQRWARVLFLLIKKNHQMDVILTLVQTYTEDLSKGKNHLVGVPVKLFILLVSLIQELQVLQEKVADSGKKAESKSGQELVETVGHLTSGESSLLIQKFANSFLSILEVLVSFAKSTCDIFWSGVVDDIDLPSSIRGKLGGPSQRRLSSFIATEVLQAIMSVKVVASITSWCAQFETEGKLNFVYIFFWNFFGKILSLQTSESETALEVRLASYEALAYVLKAVVSQFSCLAWDLIMEDYKPTSLDVEAKSLLDTLVPSFLHSVNNLIAVEKLARSRRAVLLNSKWTCLEYLLSIPSHAFNEGVYVGSSSNLITDATLHLVFGDIVDSLENAGEESVLPMLRSVRLVLELFHNRSLSSGDGVDVEMIWRLVHSSWILHVSCNKRRVAPIAALLSSILHNSVFSKKCMHEIDGEPGPLKWFVEKVLEEGTRSPRTIRLAALHLTGLWLLNPKIIQYYMKELKLLTLYGSVAFDEDFEAELAENSDARREASLLAKCSDSELAVAFINTELYARVSVSVLFNKLADLAAMVGAMDENESCGYALKSGKMFLMELLDLAVNDKDIAKELYKKYSGIHRRKIRVWQMICILSRFVDEDILQTVTSSLHISLYRNNLPAVRQYLESFGINIYLKFPSLVTEQLVPIFRNYDLRPQALSSYVFIAANVIRHAPSTVQYSHLLELLPPIIPLLTSHHHSLRGFTQLLVFQVLIKLLPPLDSCSYKVSPLEKRCFEDLKLYLANNSDCSRLRASMEHYLEDFNPNDSITPAGIFSNRIEEVEFECVPTSLMEQVTIFLNDVREDLRCSMAKDAEIIKNESLRVCEDPTSNCAEKSENTSKGEMQPQLAKELLLDFQRKIIISKHDMDDAYSDFSSWKNDNFKPLMELEKEDQLLEEILQSTTVAMEKIRGDRQSFILVGSLLDRIPNLAGLARTCEVFKAAGLAVADTNIVRDKQFQLISVTAEKWVPIIEVPLGNLKVFLLKKKCEGFSILGLEQTANSIPLDQFAFPKKTVLVLGREKEGIPVDLINFLDACIEIPQLGVVRSLNVHVSGAIALWEYTRQQRSL